MRIGIDATTIYTSTPTGLGVYAINIVNELAKIHDDLVVWTVDDTALRVDPSKVRRVLQPFRFMGNFLFQLRALWVETCFRKMVENENIDVLYSTIPNGLTKSPVPHVVTVHDLIPLVFPEDAPRTVTWNFKHRIPRILGNAARVVCVSEYTRRDVEKWYGLGKEKTVHVSEGFDRSVFFRRESPAVLHKHGLDGKQYLLYVGNCSKRKGVETLISAFARVAREVPHDLVVAGRKSPVQRKMLTDLVSAAGVADRVHFLDYVAQNELAPLYSGASAFVFVSQYEGFGLPVIEAMACGTPVITSNVSSVPEVAGDAAVLVDPLDEAAIARAIIATITDAALQEDLRNRGLVRSSLYDWRHAASEILEVLAAAR